MRTLSCHPAKHFTCLFSLYSGHLRTSSKILTYIMQSDITIKENTETILQLAANMRISCLRPNLYPVREATLETLCLRTYILFHSTPLLRTLAITDTKSPPRLSAITGVECIYLRTRINGCAC